jgi:hypothetical protein
MNGLMRKPLVLQAHKLDWRTGGDLEVRGWISKRGGLGLTTYCHEIEV